MSVVDVLLELRDGPQLLQELIQLFSREQVAGGKRVRQREGGLMIQD